MDTSGLEPTELRAVLHALVTAAPSGAAAQRFMAMLQERMPSLPDYAPTAWDPFENASVDAPLGFASGRGTSVKPSSMHKRPAVVAAAPTNPPPPPTGAVQNPPPNPPPPPPPPPPQLPKIESQRASRPRSNPPDAHAAMLDEIVRRASRRNSAVAEASSTPEEGAESPMRI